MGGRGGFACCECITCGSSDGIGVDSRGTLAGSSSALSEPCSDSIFTVSIELRDVIESRRFSDFTSACGCRRGEPTEPLGECGEVGGDCSAVASSLAISFLT